MKNKVIYLLLPLVTLASCQRRLLLSVTPLDPPSADEASAVVHQVTFLDDNKEVLATIEVKDGETAVYPYELPKDKSTETEYYKFSGWDQSLENVHSDLIVTALYDSFAYDGKYAFGLNRAGGYILGKYTGTDVNPLIPETYNGLPVNAIGNGSFAENTTIERIELPDSIVAIDNGAFAQMPNLKGVKLSSELLSIGQKAFYGDVNLASVSFPEKLEIIDAQAFFGNIALKEIILPDSLQEVGNEAFFGNLSVEKLSIGKGLKYYGSKAFTTYSSTLNDVSSSSAYFPFDGTALYYVIDEDRTLADGTVIHYDFNGIIDTKSNAVIDSYTVKEGTEIIGEYAFAYSQGIKKITLPSSLTTDEGFAYIGSNVEEVVYAQDSLVDFDAGTFSGATKLNKFTLPSSLTYIPSYAFEGANGFREVTIPEGITKIGHAAFINNKGVEKITLPSTLESLEYMDDMPDLERAEATFAGAQNLREVLFDENAPLDSIPTGAFAGARDEAGNLVTLEKLNSIKLPKNIKHIGQYAFQNAGLVSIDLSALADVEDIGDSFLESNANLTTITMPAKFNVLTSIPFRFAWGAKKLTSVSIPEGITSIGNQAFYDTVALAIVDFPSTLKTLASKAFTLAGDAKSNVTTINYNGSKADFDQIAALEDNFDLTKAKVTTKAPTQP